MTVEIPNHNREDCRAVSSILARVGDKWTVLIVVLLGEGPKRFNEIKRMIGGISQRMLTQTLRDLQRDGYVDREVFPTKPPSVEYRLTELGRSLYAPLADELDVEPLWRDALTTGKTLALPRFYPETGSYLACRVLNPAEDLKPGQFGIPEPGVNCPPVALKRLDFILAPGVGFTLDGRRLGRGKGFYDRLLSSVRGSKCGIAFDEQIVDDIPAELHDIRLDYILTPTRWFRAGQDAVWK